jgi:hypothetical protein
VPCVQLTTGAGAASPSWARSGRGTPLYTGHTRGAGQAHLVGSGHVLHVWIFHGRDVCNCWKIMRGCGGGGEDRPMSLGEKIIKKEQGKVSSESAGNMTYTSKRT